MSTATPTRAADVFHPDARAGIDLAKQSVAEGGELDTPLLMAALYHAADLDDDIPQLAGFLDSPEPRHAAPPDAVPLANSLRPIIGRLTEAGFSADTTYQAYHVLDGHIFGFSLWETAHSFSEEEETEMQELFENVITPEAFPYLREHGRQHMVEGPHHDVSAFEFGLDLILDGLKKIHAA